MNRQKLAGQIASSVLEALGKEGGREGAGGAGSCTCPSTKCSEYGKSVPHTRGVPCNKKKCVKCGSSLTGKGAPKSKVKS